MDLATAVEFTLLDQRPQKIPTDIKGPIQINGVPVGALLIGRSSASISGLMVLTGLIDADFCGTIQIMAQTLFPPLVIPKGSKIAQVIPLPNLTAAVPPASQTARGEGGFGSTGPLTLLTVDLGQRPKRPVTVEYQTQTLRLLALLDTGADVSIVSQRLWPSHWPAYTSSGTIAGVGGITVAQKSPPVRITIEDHAVTCAISILPLPDGVQALIGRDVLAQMGMVLTTDKPF